MTGLNRTVLHSSEFAATAKNKNNPSLNVTDQYNIYKYPPKIVRVLYIYGN